MINRVFDSSGPEGKVRGTPQQIIDKYNQLARDAQVGNDRVAAENFQQHAEHYLRLLSEAQREIDQRREEQERQNRERQAERDRERSERQDRDSGPSSGSDSQGDDPGYSDQPDLVETTREESGLVETPEGKPKPKRAPRPRKPKTPKGSDDAGSAKSGSSDNPQSPDNGTPEAAE